MLYVTRKCIFVRFYCTTSNRNAKSYAKTILLPQTKFPLKLKGKALIQRDIDINESKSFKVLYSWQEKRLKEPTFILHDGPPYANGSVHMGHAINKILKDTIIRYKIINGQKVSYIPGWDCHGLPIELKAVNSGKNKLKPIDIRIKARSFATETIYNQKKSFESWGVIGDWEKAYKTYDVPYIVNQMKQFHKLFEKNIIYRDVKPVYWSPSTRTALAEAELEYNENHKSTAVILRLKTVKLPDLLTKYHPNVYALIWTTTPWTLPSNQAICYHEKLQYSLISFDDGNYYLVASELINSIAKKIGKNANVLETFPGSLLHSTRYKHPLYDEELPFLNADHTTATKGTGLVHTAPAHGPDDFLVALKQKMKVRSLVDETGRYVDSAGPDLNNLFVLADGQDKVMDILKQHILHTEDYIHSYPYDWRTKKPVILRASNQWFIDTNAIKERAIELLQNVDVLPKIHAADYKTVLVNQLKKRPYWCISRQRSWGVPIPVFYEKSTGKFIVNSDTIQHLCTMAELHGPDFWWNLSVEELLPTDNKYDLKDIQKGEDIMDIWFDSGLSWHNVLGAENVADMYLEGVDQFTGWFQSSLLTSVALRDKSPYKSIYAHGFAVDKNGMKMSKSLGNVVSPEDIIRGAKGQTAYGIDVLRWWVVCHANQQSTTHVSPTVLQASADEVQKIRSILRYSLSCLYDYKDAKVNYSLLNIVDKYMLHLLYDFNRQMESHVKEYEFSKLRAGMLHFLTNHVSGTYYSAIKDRLYCDCETSTSRQSAQHVLYNILLTITKIIGPIVPHLVEELYAHLPQKRTTSYFQIDYEASDDWDNAEIGDIVDVLMNVKREINRRCDGSTLKKRANVRLPAQFTNLLKGQSENVENELCDLFQVAQTTVTVADRMNEPFELVLDTSDKHLCERCRRYASNNEDKLCDRCETVVADVESVKNTAKS